MNVDNCTCVVGEVEINGCVRTAIDSDLTFCEVNFQPSNPIHLATLP